MSFKVLIQLGFASVPLLLSTGVAWYEGSTLLNEPWEWKHTAIFSQMANGSVESINDILPIDHFVYAAKFAPTFPLLMLLSCTYLIVLIGFILLKRNVKIFSCFLVCIGVLFLILSGFISNSPTIGLKIFFYSFVVIGILSIVIALSRIFNNKTEEVY
jgi:hypothetical protein